MADIDGTQIGGLAIRTKATITDKAAAWIPYEDLSASPVDTFRFSVTDLLSGLTVDTEISTILYASTHGLTSGAIGKPIGWKADGKPYVWTDTASTEIPVAIVQAITDANHLEVTPIGQIAEIANTLLPGSLPVYSADTNSRLLCWDTSAAVYKHITQGDSKLDTRIIYWIGLKEGDPTTSICMVLPPGTTLSPATLVANVRDFGAMCDSTTDDTLAIQAAIDSNRPLVYFPGNPNSTYYKTTDTLQLNNDNQHIYGDGPSSIIHCNANEKKVLRVAGASAADRVTGVTISDLWVQGINATVASPSQATSVDNGVGISIEFGNRVVVRNCLISHCHGNGMYIYTSSGVAVKDNWFFEQYWTFGQLVSNADINVWIYNEDISLVGNHCHSNVQLHINASGYCNEVLLIADNVCFAADANGDYLLPGRGISGSSDDAVTNGRQNIALIYTDTLTAGTRGRAIVRGNFMANARWCNLYYNTLGTTSDDIGHRVTIHDNVALWGASSVNSGADVSLTGGFCIHAGRELNVHDNLIIETLCTGSTSNSAGLRLQKTHDGGQWSIRGNVITNCPGYGAMVTGGASNIIFDSNYIYNCGHRIFNTSGTRSLSWEPGTEPIPAEVQIASINTGTDVLTASGAHSLTDGDRVRFQPPGTAGTATTFPKFVGGIWDKTTTFWVRDVAGLDFKLSATPINDAGTALGDPIDITATFSGGTFYVKREKFIGGNKITNNMILENVSQKLGAVMTFPSTDVSVANDRITYLGHGFETGDKLIFDNATPANLFSIASAVVTNDTEYFVKKVSVDVFELTSTAGGSTPLDITAAGTGTHIMRLVCGESLAGIYHIASNTATTPDTIADNVIVGKGGRVSLYANYGIYKNDIRPVIIRDNYVEGYYTGIYLPATYTSRMVNDIDIQGNHIWNCVEAFNIQGNVNALVIIDDSNRANSDVSYRHRTTPNYCSLWGTLRNGLVVAGHLYREPKTTVTTTNGVTNFSCTGHGYLAGDRVQLSGTIPASFSAATNYWLTNLSATDTFQLSATRGGSAITPTSTVSSGLTMTHQVPAFGTWAVGDNLINDNWNDPTDPREWVCTTAGAIGTCVWTPSYTAAGGTAYAAIYTVDGVTAQTPAQNTWTKATGFATDGVELNCDADVANDRIGITQTGTYQVMFQVSFSADASSYVQWRVYTGASPSATYIKCKRALGTTGDIGSASGQGVLSLTAGDYVELWLYSDDGTPSITPVDLQLSVHRIN